MHLIGREQADFNERQVCGEPHDWADSGDRRQPDGSGDDRLPLAGAHLEAVFAEDGKRGLAMLRDASPSLVITDIFMPEKEGIETIMEIRKTDRDLPIIAMSGGCRSGGAPDFLKTASALGASDTLAKPFDPSNFLAMVKRHLPAVRSAIH